MSLFAERILDFHFSLTADLILPDGIEWLYPYDRDEVRSAMKRFFGKYFSDCEKRYVLLGINPGRFGAGITGIPFTDPIRMESECGLKNHFQKRQELSSVFVYDFINEMGGPKQFYQNFYITSVCPLGFVKDGKNYNYYDDRALTKVVMSMIVNNIEKHLEFGIHNKIAFSMGQGKNYKFLKEINEEHCFFEKIVPLPHPRWVMQYRLKRKQEFIDEYVQKLSSVLGTVTN